MTSIADVRAMPFDQTGLTHTTAKNIARLVRVVEEMEVDLQWRDLGATRRGQYIDGAGGRYYDRSGLIELNTRLRGFQVVSTLGHEIAHAMFGDTSSTGETEERAMRIGAALAVDPAQFRRARIAGQPVYPKHYGIAPMYLLALDATPHADSGCPCFPCNEFRTTVMEELAGLRESWREATARLVG